MLLNVSSDLAGYPAYDLDDKWEPLETIRQRPSVVSDVGVSETVIATVGRSAYVADLEAWLDKHPPDSPTFNAIVRHEQEHSRRQLAAGTFLWIARYSADKKFAWREEQIGWYWELITLQSQGIYPNAVQIALTISKYKNLVGRLVSFEDAKEWVLQVLNGQWEPD